MSKGNKKSSSDTNITSTNQQVATESGIALGANASGNQISITSSDADVTRAALAAGVASGRDSLSFAGHAADVAAQTNMFALRTVEGVAGKSIDEIGRNSARGFDFAESLSTKFAQGAGELAAQNIGLLSSISNANTDVALNAQDKASRALDQSFAVSKSTAPQDANFSLTEVVGTASKTIIFVIVGIAVVVGLFFAFRKRA